MVYRAKREKIEIEQAREGKRQREQLSKESDSGSENRQAVVEEEIVRECERER